MLLFPDLNSQQIKELFENADIFNFEKNSDDIEWKKMYSKKFIEFNKYLDAAKIQGFRWKELIYEFEDETSNKYEVTLELDETTYLVLVQRYKELFTRTRGTGFDDIPYDIDTHIMEVQTDAIDDDYMNSRFKIYLKAINKGDSKTKEKAFK